MVHQLDDPGAETDVEDADEAELGLFIDELLLKKLVDTDLKNPKEDLENEELAICIVKEQMIY